MLQLKPGQYFGETRWERSLPGLRLTLSTYQPRQTQPWHRHAHPTFFLLLAGDHNDITRQGAHRQLPYSLVFHPTTTDHVSELGTQPVRGLNIEYEPHWLARYELTESDLRQYQVFSSLHARLAALRFLGIAFQTDPLLHPRHDAELDTQAFELLVPLASQELSKPASPRCLPRAEEYLHAHFREPISLRDVAQEVHVHPVYLARVFRKTHQCTISHYLRTLRLTEAARLVLQGLPLAQAAYTAGFADQAHFARCCSTTMGFSPKHFRTARQAMGI